MEAEAKRILMCEIIGFRTKHEGKPNSDGSKTGKKLVGRN
jgi:hypothetical protein